MDRNSVNSRHYTARVYDKKSGEYRPASFYNDATVSAPVSGAKRRAENRRKRRRRRLCVFYIFIFLFVLATAAFLSLKVLFKISSIKVEGTSCYTAQQVKQNSGLKLGENLILANTHNTENTICKKLPYIGTVKVSRNFPAEIIIKVAPAVACGAVKNGTKYIIISQNGKVLSVTGNLPTNSALIKGVDVLSANAGEQIKLKDTSKTEIIKNVFSVLSNEKMEKITSIDFSKSNKINVVYDKRIIINLGVPSNLDYKIRFAKNILKNKIQNNEKGTLDMSTAADNNRAYFDPDYSRTSSLSSS